MKHVCYYFPVLSNTELQQTHNNIKNDDDGNTNKNDDDDTDNEHSYDENNDVTKCCPKYIFCIIIKLKNTWMVAPKKKCKFV